MRALGLILFFGLATAAAAQEPVAVDPITVSRTSPAPFIVSQGDVTAAPPPIGVGSDNQPGPPPVLSAQTTQPPQPPDTPDETALRYFAQQGDTVRLQREIERLRALYPNWQPPADPLASDFVPDQDIIRIWDLVTAGDYAGARAAIAEKQASDPSYSPTADLIQTIERGEAGTKLRTASDAGDYDTVISIAANAPQLLTCASVDNLWRLAEAFAKTGKTSRAIDAYGYVLTNCTVPEERFATMQKAMDVLDRSDLEPLLALEKTGEDGKGEFESLRLDLARRAVAAALEEGGAVPPSEDVELLTEAAESGKNAEDLQLLGYFELDRGRPAEARRYFETAFEVSPSAEAAEGLGVALLQLDEPHKAEDILADFRDDGEALDEVYRDAAAALLSLEPRPTIAEAVLSRIVVAALEARDADIAQALGWYAYAFNQPQTALEWFETALGWQSDLEPAAYGIMVAANALGNTARVEEIRKSWGGRSVRIAQFGSVSATSFNVPLPRPRPAHTVQVVVREAPPQRAQPVAVEASSGGSGGGGSGGGGGGCEIYRPPASLSPAGALNHAWCLMRLNRPAQAADHFARALDSASVSVRSDAAYGQALAFVRLGLADEAAVAAAAAPLPDKRAIELEIAILTLKATSAYGVGDYSLALAMLDRRSRYAPERNDLLTLRAWSYYHLKRYREAERIFEAVAATGYADAVAGLEASRSSLLGK